MSCNLLPEYPLTFTQLRVATHQLAAQAYRPGTSRNQVQQASTFIKFCDHYHLPFINPSMSTICCYITHLTHHFKSSASVRNYLSGVRFLHKQLGLTTESLDSFPVTSLLRAARITMRTPPLGGCPSSLPCFFNCAISLHAWGPWARPCGCA